MEKEFRGKTEGSNPHSKGLNFSREERYFLKRIKFKRISTRGIIRLTINIKNISFSFNRSFNWKLNILFILKMLFS